MKFSKKNIKIYIAGHNGMLGSSVCRMLKKSGYNNQVYKNKADLDLRESNSVFEFLEIEKPDVIVNCAGRVGGILANINFPYEYLIDNLKIQNNLFESAIKLNIPKFIFIASSTIYPPNAPQPFKEEYLLSDHLESSNEFYAISKIAGIKMCKAIKKQFNKDYVCLIPSNLYGINDHFDLTNSHVLQALIRKINDAKENNKDNVVLWGDGNPMREFTYVDDFANAVIFSIENRLKDYMYNIGSGQEISIKNLAYKIKSIVGYKGEILWDSDKPNGSMRKIMDSSKIKSLGWQHEVDLDLGIKLSNSWYLNNKKKFN